MKSRRIPLLITTLALAGSFAVLTFRSPSRTASTILPNPRAPVVCVPERESPAGRKTGESAARRLPAIAPRAAVAAQPPEPAPASTRAAYPGQDELPASWHDFGRARTKITVAPYPDLPLTFERTAVKDEGRYVTWFGTVREIPGSSLVAVATPGGGFHSVMIVPGSSQFAFDTDAEGETIISESQPGEEGCAIGGVMPDRTTAQAPTTSAIFKAQYTGALASYTVGSNYTGSPSEVAFGSSALEGDALQVGVLFLYDAAALAAAGSADTIDGRSKAYIESGNVVLANSAVTAFRWKYLGVKQAPAYTRPDAGAQIDFDLNAIATGGAIGDWVAGQAYQTGAAQVLLWLPNNIKGATSAGIAHTGGKAIAVNSAGRARAIALWGTSYKATIHELGHNFGCQHDRANAGANGTGLEARDADGFYCYGSLWNSPFVWTYTPGPGASKTVNADGSLTFIENGATTTIPASATFANGTYTVTSPRTAGTIMSYGSSVIPYFSNPNISVRVTSALADYSGTNIDVDWGTLPLGLPVTDPRAAYNAKVLNDNAATIAAFGAAIVAPAITTQPQNVSATSGSNFSLSVTATGGGLSYQWSKDGSAISGATASSYAKTSASADAGAYTVTVSNLAGAVTSSSATVTVTTQPPPPPPSGGGSGGGGGAPSGWFLAALATLALIRCYLPRFSVPNQ